MMGKCEKYYVANIYMGYLAAYEYNHLGLKGGISSTRLYSGEKLPISWYFIVTAFDWPVTKLQKLALNVQPTLSSQSPDFLL